MPELPEVEVLVRHLAPRLQGRRILEATVHRARSVRPQSAEQMTEALQGATLESVSRRGKYLCFGLRSGQGTSLSCVGHLGMTGRMYLQPLMAPLPKHAVVTWRFADARFVFEDARGFGRLNLETTPIAALGPEPFDPSWTPERLVERLGNSRQPIKVKLLDQHLMAGVGNIYASEALHQAGISPRRPSGRLGLKDAAALLQALQSVLSRAIELGSRATLDFKGGGDGLFYYGSSSELEGVPVVERFDVYDRAGEPCRRCGAVIRRTVQAQRSTYHCPQCQRR